MRAAHVPCRLRASLIRFDRRHRVREKHRAVAPPTFPLVTVYTRETIATRCWPNRVRDITAAFPDPSSTATPPSRSFHAAWVYVYFFIGYRITDECSRLSRRRRDYPRQSEFTTAVNQIWRKSCEITQRGIKCRFSDGVFFPLRIDVSRAKRDLGS